MKSLIHLLSVLSLLLGVRSHAGTGNISCSNGDIGKVGDRHFQILILEDGIQFLPYESSFTLDASQVKYGDGLFSIVNQAVKVTAEGEQSTQTINALLILNEKKRKLNVAISYDKGPFLTVEMSCRKSK